MGQRLVITIEKEQKQIAKIYFHWSAYSVSALEEARDILEDIKGIVDITNIQRAILEGVIARGGGLRIDGNEWENAKKLFPNIELSVDFSRNYGIVAFTKDGMENLQQSSDGDLLLNLDDNILVNWVNFTVNFNQYVAQHELENEKVSDIVYISDINPNVFKFEDIYRAIEIFKVAQANGKLIKYDGEYTKLVY